MTDIAIQKKKKHTIKWPDVFFRIVLLLPAFIILIIFMYYPIIETFRISLTKTAGLGEEVYIGFQNYIKLFKNDDFLAGLWNVFQWAIFSVLIQIPLAFFIAFTCSTYKSGLIKKLKSIYYLSNVIPMAIISMLGLFIFMPNVGAIVTLAKTLNWKWLGAIDFIGDPGMAFWTLFIIATWAYIGFQIVYIMANINQIPEEIHEAALIDGVNKWQYAWYIVIPQISYALRIQVLLCTIGSIKLFDLPWLVTVGGPGNATTTLGIVLYKEGFLNWQYGKGAAVGVVIFLLSLIFTIVQFSIQRKTDKL